MDSVRFRCEFSQCFHNCGDVSFYNVVDRYEIWNHTTNTCHHLAPKDDWDRDLDCKHFFTHTKQEDGFILDGGMKEYGPASFTRVIRCTCTSDAMKNGKGQFKKHVCLGKSACPKKYYQLCEDYWYAAMCDEVRHWSAACRCRNRPTILSASA